MDSKTAFYLLSLYLVILPVQAESLTGKVLKVTDGDTVTVSHQDKKIVTRLACVDAPEKNAPMGKEASDRLKELLPIGTSVKLNIVDSDRYGRSVAEIYKRRTFINLTMVREGKALVYRKYLNNCAKPESLLKAEKQAQKQKLGFWGLPIDQQIFPWDWRRTAKN